MVDDNMLSVGGFGFVLREDLFPGEPVQSLFKIAKGPHVPTFDATDKGEQSCTLISVCGMNNCKMQIAGEADVAKGVYDGCEFVGRKFGARVAAVEHGAIDAAPLAGFGEAVKRGTSGYQVKFAFSSKADELRRTYNFNLNRHFSRWLPRMEKITL